MNNSQDKSKQFEERLLTFSLSIISLTKSLAQTPENKVIVSQLLRSATSIGANYAEANNAASKIDFRNKIFIAKKEAAETKYWLKLLEAANEDVSCHNELDEVSQFLFILQKIISTLKNGK